MNIIGVTETVLKNLETLRSVIDEGLARRHHGKSAFNANSSRSHAIFQITCKDTHQKSNTFRLIFIDLAGSERAIDAQNNQRQTRREGAQINSSLLALKECIRSMDLTHTHAPFRQSKLTHILRDSLVGTKTRTCLMANVSPADDCCQCSLNTLQYASRIRDISIRHRHRSMPLTSLKTNSFVEENPSIVGTLGRDKPQKTFKPGTASTPVHRLISSVDQRIYMGNPPDDRRESRTGKSLNVDWQLVEDDIPISGSGDNLPPKMSLTSTREFLLNVNTNSEKPMSSFYLSRFEQQKRQNRDKDEGLSSYFPPPQTDIKKSLPIQTEKPKDYLHHLNNERQWKTVPAPPISSSRRQSDSSIEPSLSTRIIPIAPPPFSDDNQYSSTTATESLGTKITKLAAGTNPFAKLHKTTTFVENLNLHKHYDTATTTTMTSETEQGFYSDRQATHRDQTGFFSNRDDPYYGSKYNLNILFIQIFAHFFLLLAHHLSEPLPTILQETSSTLTPVKATPSHQLSTASYRNQSQNSFSSPHKSHHRNYTLKSSTSSRSSSNSTLSDGNRSPSPHHRIIPLQLSRNSDSEDFDVRVNDTPTVVKNIHVMRNAKEQTDDQSTSPVFPTQLLHAPLDQFRRLYDSSTPLRKSLDFPKEIQPNSSINERPKDFRRRRTDLIPVTRTSSPMADDDIYRLF